MKKYRIKINYITGNSFNTTHEEDYVDHEWNNLDKAKESLKRIKNHYEYYQRYSNEYEKPKGKLPAGVTWIKKYRVIGLELILDDGALLKYSPFWTGYFESLECAEIVSDDTDMKYTP